MTANCRILRWLDLRRDPFLTVLRSDSSRVLAGTSGTGGDFKYSDNEG